MNKFFFIDLFAGTSALSEGFIKEGMTPVAHVEMDPQACATIRTRAAYHYLKENNETDKYLKYLQRQIGQEELLSDIPSWVFKLVINEAISGTSFKQIKAKIEENLSCMGGAQIDLIIGGPPCQAYSMIGRCAIDFSKDKRLTLFRQYGRYLEHYKPKMFVFENVPGIYTAGKGLYLKELKRYYAKIGYEVEDRILNAADYGVLQHRKRVIIIGWDKSLPIKYPQIDKVYTPGKIWDILNDLKTLIPGEEEKVGEYTQPTNQYLEASRIRNGSTFYTQHQTRPHNSNDREIYKIAIYKWHKEQQRIKYNTLPDKLKTQKNNETFLDRFKVVHGDGLSHTVVAHISKDGHYYIHPDIKQCRSLSIREAARIQSFPDDFFFEGSRTAIFRQIGNAVPPLMAEAIAKGIKKELAKV